MIFRQKIEEMLKKYEQIDPTTQRLNAFSILETIFFAVTAQKRENWQWVSIREQCLNIWNMYIY